MSDTAHKARALRLARLGAMLDERLDRPPAALEALLSEMALGESIPDQWERLHAAATRDGCERELGLAYQRVATPRRLRALPAAQHVEVLMHAADFHLGILGDRDGSTRFLQRVLDVVPDHPEAFQRLETRFESAGDRQQLGELYAKVAAHPPRPPDQLARQVVNTVVPLPAKTPLSDEACRKLLTLASSSLRVIDVLDAHACRTGRPLLACALRETALETLEMSEPTRLEQRRRLLELYLGEAKTPARAMDHVEVLLDRDPDDKKARDAAQKLLSHRDVASRAASALHAARQNSLKPRPGR